MYPINLTFMIYGQRAYCNETDSPLNQIREFETFVQNNSEFIINESIIYDTVLAQSELGLWTPPTVTSDCYFYNPWNLTIQRRALVPEKQHVVFLLWDALDLPVCWNGGTWGGNYGVTLRPTVSVPLYIPHWCNTFGRYNSSGTQVLVHEFLHALNYMICTDLSFGTDCILNVDTCLENGFTTPDWYDCHQYILSQVTTPMYNAISGLFCDTPVANLILS